MVRATRVWAGLVSLIGVTATASPAPAAEPSVAIMEIPVVADGPRRRITTSDLARLRDIASLSVAPRGDRFVILVRQAVPETNSYRTAWFAGSFAGGALTPIADGGEARQLVRPDGRTSGDFGGSVARWSPDGAWIAYAVKQSGEVQLWRALVDGSAVNQVSHNRGDVRDFIWSGDGMRLLFTAEAPRDERDALRERRAREGARLQDFPYLSHAFISDDIPVPLSANPAIFSANADGTDERPADADEIAAFEASRNARFSSRPGGTESAAANLSGAVRPPIVRDDGALAWLAKVDESQMGQIPVVRLRASLTGRQEDAVICSAPECEGQYFPHSWWSADGSEVLFVRFGGATGADLGFHAWNPSTGRVRTVRSAADEALQDCDLYGEQVICLRQERLVPNHVAAIDVATGRVDILADVNPEFRSFELGRLERIEWDTPEVPGGAGYSRRTHGYILYPPGYDPSRRYPLFVAPYSTWGFMRGDAGDEHPLLVYAANDIVVLDSAFPMDWNRLATCADFACTMGPAYDPALGYPHMSVYAETTFAGIDAAAERASIDRSRVGIGGVSHGAFIPLFMVQRRDRLAALSIASGGWSQLEYYITRPPEPYATEPDPSHLWPRDAAFWEGIDLSHHLDTVEAPILFHFADRELYTGFRLVRDLSDAHLPFEAYTFQNEFHFKFHPAHRFTIYNRNLDWFRFWLQDIEDPDPAKAEQYARWRQLRALQCANARSTRNYCDVASRQVPPAR